AHKIGRAVDTGKSLIDRLCSRQVVDQHHGSGAFAAEIPAERWPLPEHLQIAGVFRIEHAFAVAQSAEKDATRLLPHYTRVRLAPLAAVGFDHGGKPWRHGAEKAMPRVNQLARRKILLRRGWWVSARGWRVSARRRVSPWRRRVSARGRRRRRVSAR